MKEMIINGRKKEKKNDDEGQFHPLVMNFDYETNDRRRAYASRLYLTNELNKEQDECPYRRLSDVSSSFIDSQYEAKNVFFSFLFISFSQGTNTPNQCYFLFRFFYDFIFLINKNNHSHLHIVSRVFFIFLIPFSGVAFL